jgi:CheY-like chemotaxis protein
MDVSITRTDIAEKLDYIYTFFKPEVEQKGIAFFYKNALTEDDAIIYSDREKIYGILTNLVKNAIKFTLAGTIRFGCEKKGNFLEFYVTDTGVGIKEELKELIFDRFRQGSESYSRNYEGAGLGLAISKAYVELLGGKIWVESEMKKGSSFYFTIPYVAKEADFYEKDCEEQTLSDENPERKLKILIAEDDEPSSKLIALAVKALSYEMILVKNGLDAVEACKNNADIDLILMDNKMALMDGYEATRQIRLFNKDVIIISQTAFALTGDREKVLKAGCNDYITKPFNPKALRNLIKKYF